MQAMATAGRDLVIGTAGHIDHGKTALVRALTGVDTDRLPAEKQRGITIDLGFAALDLPGGGRLALVDVPGHERFIRNMLAGATGLDLALLVVAADDSVMPQTREHLEILRLLGLRAGVVALTKCDMATDSAWLDLVEDDVKALVAGSFFEGAPVIRTSAANGMGIEELRRALRALCESAPARDDPGLFRLAIDRAFTVAGHGTVVTGTVASGRVSVGDELQWHPEGRAVRVRGLQRHDRPVESLGRGVRAAINLVGVHHAEVRRGQELGRPGYLAASRVLSVEVRPTPDAPRPLRHRGRYRLHLGTAEVAATLSILDDESQLAQLLLGEPAVAVSGQPFVLRAESPAATLGGGLVLETSGRRLRRRDRDDIERIDALRSPDPHRRASAALKGFGLRPWTDRTLCREANLAIDAVGPTVDALVQSGTLIELPVGPRRSIRVPSGLATDLESRVLRALGRLHAARPRQAMIPRAHVAGELPDLADALISGLLDRLKERGLIEQGARTVALKGHQAKLSQGERKLKGELAGAIRAGGFSPPDLADLTKLAGARGPAVADLLALLADEMEIVAISSEFYLGYEAATDLRRRVVEALADSSALTVAELRDLLGTTRKYAVPIAEYLDREHLTIRDGDVRRAFHPSTPSPKLPG